MNSLIEREYEKPVDSSKSNTPPYEFRNTGFFVIINDNKSRSSATSPAPSHHPKVKQP